MDLRGGSPPPFPPLTPTYACKALIQSCDTILRGWVTHCFALTAKWASTVQSQCRSTLLMFSHPKSEASSFFRKRAKKGRLECPVADKKCLSSCLVFSFFCLFVLKGKKIFFQVAFREFEACLNRISRRENSPPCTTYHEFQEKKPCFLSLSFLWRTCVSIGNFCFPPFPLRFLSIFASFVVRKRIERKREMEILLKAEKKQFHFSLGTQKKEFGKGENMLPGIHPPKK